jgi:hypothetical protein
VSPVQLAEETGRSEVYSLLMQAMVGRSTDQALEQSVGRMAAAKVRVCVCVCVCVLDDPGPL